MAGESTVILSACRTPIGRYLGGLSGLSAVELGVVAAREALRRSGVDPSRVDEAIVGNVLSAGLGQAPARQVALGAGMPSTSSALTVNMVCGSGLRAVMLADAAIRAGDACDRPGRRHGEHEQRPAPPPRRPRRAGRSATRPWSIRCSTTA